MSRIRPSIIAAVLAALGLGPPADAAEVRFDPAIAVICTPLLQESVRLTVEAYVAEGYTLDAARAEAELMRPDLFFFWPADYFLTEPGIADPTFLARRAAMNAVWDRSAAIGCGIGFHPVPES